MSEKGKIALLAPFRSAVIFVMLTSSFVNILVLTSPFFMLLVYGNVVPSSSVETLIAFAVLATVLFMFYGAFDYLRGRVSARIGAGLQTQLDPIFIDLRVQDTRSSNTKNLIRDLEKFSRFLSMPVALGLIDIYWTPLFVVLCFIFHPLLGLFTLGAIAISATLAIASQVLTKNATLEAQRTLQKSELLAQEYARENEIVSALGMKSRLYERWLNIRTDALQHSTRSGDRLGFFVSATRSFRLVAQSGILGLGAYLAIKGEIPTGVMIAGSILMGRAMAPTDLVIGQWRQVTEALSAWKSIKEGAKTYTPRAFPTELPRPKGRLKVTGVYAGYDGDIKKPTIQNVNFLIEPGTALGIIGQSASGKSTLIRTIMGVLPLLSGKIELDGAAISQYDPEKLGSYIGYLPQEVGMLSGTIAENISRFDDSPDRDQKIVEAAKLAGAHDMIVALEKGYDTLLPSALSGGQKQRIALCRAIYGSPSLVILDEANSNLDAEGTEALNNTVRTLKKQGAAFIIVAHRPNALQECEYLLMMERGRVRDYGPIKEVLNKNVQNFKVAKGA